MDPPLSIVRIMLTTFAGYFIARFILVPGRVWDDDAELALRVQTLARGLRPA